MTPIVVDRREVRVDTLVMLAATALMSVAVVAGILPVWGGLVMLVCITGYILYQYKSSKIEVYEEPDGQSGANPYLFVLLGIGALLIGSEVLVQGAVAGGVALGVPEAVIGMTLIALGTSLPELTACVAVARKGQSEMIVGGIVGSNIFNIFSVMAISAMVRPLIIEPRFAQVDLPVVIGVTAAFALMLLAFGRIGRIAGGIMVAAYAAFILFQYWETLTLLF